MKHAHGPRNPRIRVVGDLHVGSMWGLWPPNFSYAGQPYPQNPWQVYLWQAWERGWKTLPKPDVLVLNGDLIDGSQPRAGGAGTVSPEPDLQEEALLQVLAPVRAGKVFVTIGTAYHEPHRLSAVARLVGAQEVAGRHVLPECKLRVRNPEVRIVVRHHPDGGNALYTGTILEREAVKAIRAWAARMLDERHDVIVVSHVHLVGWEYTPDNVLVVITPTWCAQSEQSMVRRRYTWLPRVGWVDLVVRGPGAAGVVVEPYLVEPPLKEREVPWVEL